MATKTDTPGVGISASMKPKLLKEQASKKSKVYSIHLPKLGRFAYTRDPGEGGLFNTSLYHTHLAAILREPDFSVRGVMRPGRVIDEFDLGSGLVTNAGVLQLANDGLWAAPSGNAQNAFALDKWHAWGTSATAATVNQLELLAPAAPTATAAVEGVQTLKSAANLQKLISTAKIKAESSLGITEWGLFSDKVLKSAEEVATAATATSITNTVKGYTASSGTVRGVNGAASIQGQIVQAEKPEKVFGLVLSNTVETDTVPAWSKTTDGTAGVTPEVTSKFHYKPVMFDRRVFAVINVESGNTIEFPWELEIKSGG